MDVNSVVSTNASSKYVEIEIKLPTFVLSNINLTLYVLKSSKSYTRTRCLAPLSSLYSNIKFIRLLVVLYTNTPGKRL